MTCLFAAPIDPLNEAQPVLTKLCSFLSASAPATKGIFSNETAASVNDLATAFISISSGKLPDPALAPGGAPVIGEVFKRYLMSLPEPLLGFSLYDSFMVVYDCVSDHADRCSVYRSLIAQLPKGQRAASKLVLSLLHSVCDKAEEATHMNASELSKVFWSCFLRPSEQLFYMKADAAVAQATVAILIAEGENLWRAQVSGHRLVSRQKPSDPNVSVIPAFFFNVFTAPPKPNSSNNKTTVPINTATPTAVQPVFSPPPPAQTPVPTPPPQLMMSSSHESLKGSTESTTQQAFVTATPSTPNHLPSSSAPLLQRVSSVTALSSSPPSTPQPSAAFDPLGVVPMSQQQQHEAASPLNRSTDVVMGDRRMSGASGTAESSSPNGFVAAKRGSVSNRRDRVMMSAQRSQKSLPAIDVLLDPSAQQQQPASTGSPTTPLSSSPIQPTP